MKRSNQAIQRRLLLAVLAIIVLLPIFLFVHGMVMTRHLSDRISRTAVDQIRQEMERRRSMTLEREDWECFRFFWMSLGPLQGGPIVEPSNPRPARERTRLALLQPDGRKPNLYVTIVDSPQELERRVRDIVQAGGQPLFLTPLSAHDPSRESRYVPIELVSEGVGDLLGDFTRSNNRNLLTMSLAGAILLLGLGAYIVVLSERGRRLEVQLEREKGLAYIGTLAAGLAHEIRNPLSSVLMNVQMIEQKLATLDPEQSEYLEKKITRILDETTRLNSFLNDFLRFTRPAPLKTSQANFNEVVDEAVEFLAPECARAGIQIVKTFKDDLPPVEIDRGLFAQALQNLLLNARQAIGEQGGRIEVVTRRKGGTVEVTVTDTGPGVPEEIREKMFEVFFTTKPDGTGLGLSIVKQIAEAHGGQVRLESGNSAGASFTISLPV